MFHVQVFARVFIVLRKTSRVAESGQENQLYVHLLFTNMIRLRRDIRQFFYLSMMITFSCQVHIALSVHLFNIHIVQEQRMCAVPKKGDDKNVKRFHRSLSWPPVRMTIHMWWDQMNQTKFRIQKNVWIYKVESKFQTYGSLLLNSYIFIYLFCKISY